MMEGFRRMGRVWREERKLVCPWKPRTTWYGRVLASLGVSGTVVLTVGGTALALERASDAWDKRKREQWLKGIELERARHLERKRLGLPPEPELLPPPQWKSVSKRETYNDNYSYSHWHDTPHWPSGIWWMALSGMFFSAAKEGHQFSKLATTLCKQGAYGSLSGVFVLLSAALVFRSIDNFYAAYCKANAPENDPKSAREKHQASFLRTSKILRFPLANYQ